jgi:hypothetical protein
MTTPTTPADVTLPSWTDAASVTSYLTSLLSGAVAVIAAVHPGWTEPAVVQSVIPAVGLLIAGGAQIFNMVYHRKAQIAAIVTSK